MSPTLGAGRGPTAMGWADRPNGSPVTGCRRSAEACEDLRVSLPRGQRCLYQELPHPTPPRATQRQTPHHLQRWLWQPEPQCPVGTGANWPGRVGQQYRLLRLNTPLPPAPCCGMRVPAPSPAVPASGHRESSPAGPQCREKTQTLAAAPEGKQGQEQITGDSL